MTIMDIELLQRMIDTAKLITNMDMLLGTKINLAEEEPFFLFSFAIQQMEYADPNKLHALVRVPDGPAMRVQGGFSFTESMQGPQTPALLAFPSIIKRMEMPNETYRSTRPLITIEELGFLSIDGAFAFDPNLPENEIETRMREAAQRNIKVLIQNQTADSTLYMDLEI